MSEPYLLHFTSFDDERGSLSVAEGNDLPFRIARVFWVYGVPPTAVRGGHSHISLSEIVIAAAGSFNVFVDGKLWHLNKPDVGLVVPPQCLRELSGFSYDAVALVLASHLYDPKDYR